MPIAHCGISLNREDIKEIKSHHSILTHTVTVIKHDGLHATQSFKTKEAAENHQIALIKYKFQNN